MGGGIPGDISRIMMELFLFSMSLFIWLTVCLNQLLNELIFP